MYIKLELSFILKINKIPPKKIKQSKWKVRGKTNARKFSHWNSSRRTEKRCQNLCLRLYSVFECFRSCEVLPATLFHPPTLPATLITMLYLEDYLESRSSDDTKFFSDKTLPIATFSHPSSSPSSPFRGCGRQVQKFQSNKIKWF